jgi:hypothetical protein
MVRAKNILVLQKLNNIGMVAFSMFFIPNRIAIKITNKYRRII